MLGRKSQIANKEIFVSVFVIITTGILLSSVFSTLSKKNVFAEKYILKANFSSAVDLHSGAKVTMIGIEIGRLIDIHLNSSGSIDVILEINKKYQHFIRTRSIAKMGQEKVAISDKIIEISPSSNIEEEILEDGMFINTVEPPGLNEFIEKASSSLVMFEKLLQKLDKGEGTLGAMFQEDTLYNDLLRISSGTKNILYGAKKLTNKSDKLISKLDNVLIDVKTLLNSSKNTFGIVDTTLNSVNTLLDGGESIIIELESMLKKLNTVVDDVPFLINDGTQLMTETESLVDALNNTWPISSKVPSKIVDFAMVALESNAVSINKKDIWTFKKKLQSANKAIDPKLLALYNNNLAVIYYYMNKTDSSKIFLELSNKYSISYPALSALIKINRAIIQNEKLNDISNIIQNIKESKNWAISYSANLALAKYFSISNDYSKSLEFLSISIKIANKHKFAKGISLSTILLANNSYNKNDYSKALEQINIALNIARKSSTLREISSATYLKIKVLKKLGKEKQAKVLEELYSNSL